MIPEGTLNAHSLEYLEQQQQTVESKSFTSKFAAILHNNQSRTIEWQYKEWKTRLDHISVLS